ncbi:hypothetical protein BKA63DRAFT_271662 [Paraphoma chrysanthemicola]|nr:hypothetical protein BKA63DRAFT_271662 [Paraphoma chrysanthemicola]
MQWLSPKLEILFCAFHAIRSAVSNHESTRIFHIVRIGQCVSSIILDRVDSFSWLGKTQTRLGRMLWSDALVNTWKYANLARHARCNVAS